MVATEGHVVVVGAGITGLAAAAAARDSGVAVTVVDDARASRATAAAAGMLAPFSEAVLGDAELGGQMTQALGMWDDWRQALNVPHDLFEQIPTHFVPATFGDRQDLIRWASASGVPLNDVQGILVGPMEALTDPRALVSHLRDELLATGVAFESAVVDQVTATATSVEVHGSGQLTWVADRAIVATGATSLIDNTMTVRPVRGSLIILEGPTRPEARVVRILRHGRPIYVIWRKSGEVVIGATSVETSRNVAEAGEVQLLLSDALDAFPELRELVFVEVRTGLRPTATSNTLESHINDQRTVMHLAGHYRHGILMAPLSYQTVLEFLA